MVDVLVNYVHENCPKLEQILSQFPPDLQEEVVAEFAASANPKTALDRIEDLITEETWDVIAWVLEDEKSRDPFVATVAGSRFLFSTLNRNPDLISSMFRSADCFVRKTSFFSCLEIPWLNGTLYRLLRRPHASRPSRPSAERAKVDGSGIVKMAVTSCWDKAWSNTRTSSNCPTNL